MDSGQLRNIENVDVIRTPKTDTLEQVIDIATVRKDLDVKGARPNDITVQNGKETGDRFTSFFKTVGKSIVDEGRRSRIIKINRRQLFDPLRFIKHQCFQIDEQDERSVILSEIDTSKIALESMLNGETTISREEHLKRLKQAGHIRLAASIFHAIWENRHLIPERWKGISADRKRIYFDGTVLRNQSGRYVISMYWDSHDEWRWTCCPFDKGYWKAGDVSAVLKGL
jgi:hypothetical protein